MIYAHILPFAFRAHLGLAKIIAYLPPSTLTPIVNLYVKKLLTVLVNVTKKSMEKAEYPQPLVLKLHHSRLPSWLLYLLLFFLKENGDTVRP